MRYIERVLPSLGETAVALRSLGEVVDGLRSFRHDEPAVADVKGSARMAELMRRTARQAVPTAPRDLRVFYRDDNLVLGPRELATIRRQLLSQGKRNRQVPRVANALLDAMWRQVRGERGRERGRDEFNDTLLGTAAFVDFVLSWWPPLDATDVLGWLRDPEVLGRVAEGVLSREDQELLSRSFGPVREPREVRPPPTTGRSRTSRCSTSCATSSATCPRSRAATATTTRPAGAPVRRRGARADHVRGPRRRPGRTRAPPSAVEDDGYAHVLVDEAQDLTPMQWRMVGRRGRVATWTVVGDPAQSSWPVPGRGGRPPGRRRSATRSGTPSTCRRTTATAARSTTSPPGTPSGSASTPTCPNAVRATGIDPEERPSSTCASGTRDAVGRAGRGRRGHGRDRRTGGPAGPGAGLARAAGRDLAEAASGGSLARSRCSPAWRPRAWSSTASSWWPPTRSRRSR